MVTKSHALSQRIGYINKSANILGRFLKQYGWGYLFLAPFLVLFIVFTIAPIFVGMGLSLTYYNMLQPPNWLGLLNFRILFMEDDIFLIALKNTLIFSLISGPSGYIMSLLAAWVISRLKLRRFFTLAFYAPSITSGIAMSVVWLYFFSPDRYGLLNNILFNMGLIHTPVLWNLNPATIMPVIIVISIWMSMGAGFLAFLAGLLNVPGELYDSGAVDGIKSKFQELWFITLPMIKPQLLFGSVMAIVASFSVFDIATAVAGMPSPDYAAHTIVAHMYDYAFIRFEMGYASAIAVVLFLMTFLLGRLCMRLLSSKEM